MSIFELAPTAWQSALLVFVLFVMPVAGASQLGRLKQFTHSAARLSSFRSAIVCWWVFAALALLLAGPNALFVLGYASADMAWLLDNPVAHTVAIVLLAIYFCLGFGPPLHCAMRPGARRKYSAQMRSLHFLLPVSDSERRWWVLVSITAGVCEEVFFRGFLTQFLQGQLGGGWDLDLTSAWLLASLAFGCCHFYQGLAGMARTTVAGLAFGLLAILSGSLLLPIVLHVLVDLAVLWMYHPQLDNPDRAARLVHGCASPTVDAA